MSHDRATQAARMVDEKRLWRRHLAMAKIGAIDDGGVNRQALTAEDIAARKYLVSWARRRGYEVESDEIANLFIRRPGRDNGLPCVATGSHIDTQPRGGRFDGTYGVLAGLEVFEALDEGEVETDHPLMVIVWTNEEGSRFTPGAMGSAVFAGARTLAEFRDLEDQLGIRFEDALTECLTAFADLPVRRVRPSLKAYLEAHIEQGPILEAAEVEIGAVTGIQGARWFEVSILGESGHAGTTPSDVRKDALLEAVTAIGVLREEMREPTDRLRFTVGRLIVSPNSPNTIPDRVSFSVDLRHPDEAVICSKGDIVESLCRRAMERCKAEVKETFNRRPCAFPTSIVDMVEDSARRLSLSHHRIASGAFHDALFLAEVCPTGMVFVPSESGISHHPAEYTRATHLAGGARVLAATMIRLADRALVL